MMVWKLISAWVAMAWGSLLLLPWRPAGTAEKLEPAPVGAPVDLSEITVIIPARSEADCIGRTLRGLQEQGPGLRVILVDDESTDGTAERAGESFSGKLRIIKGTPPPPGWTGKLWALEQGRREVGTELILLLDADIELAPGMAAALLSKLEGTNGSADHPVHNEPEIPVRAQGKGNRGCCDLVSLMAQLRMESFWEKLLAPAFVYFFKLIYPFALANSSRRRLGAAAGGCILVRTEMLERIGGFASVKGAWIDDCALARRIKDAGGRNWLGLTHGARSHRANVRLGDFWNMVARTAFTQLRHSIGLLMLLTGAMLLFFAGPVIGIFSGGFWVQVFSWGALGAMGASYWPVLRFYGRSPLWVVALPLIGCLYLLMTWTSAIRHWRGLGAVWKERVWTGRTM